MFYFCFLFLNRYSLMSLKYVDLLKLLRVYQEESWPTNHNEQRGLQEDLCWLSPWLPVGVPFGPGGDIHNMGSADQHSPFPWPPWLLSWAHDLSRSRKSKWQNSTWGCWAQGYVWPYGLLGPIWGSQGKSLEWTWHHGKQSRRRKETKTRSGTAKPYQDGAFFGF